MRFTLPKYFSSGFLFPFSCNIGYNMDRFKYFKRNSKILCCLKYKKKIYVFEIIATNEMIAILKDMYATIIIIYDHICTLNSPSMLHFLSKHHKSLGQVVGLPQVLKSFSPLWIIDIICVDYICLLYSRM